MPEPDVGDPRGAGVGAGAGAGAGATSRGFGRVLVFVYGVLAFAATGRATFELATKFTRAPVPYALSILAAVVYVVATWALATDRRRVAWAAVGLELIGVLAVGLSSLVWTDRFPEASVWSDFGVGYACVPLVLPFVGLAWLRHTRPRAASPSGPGNGRGGTTQL